MEEIATPELRTLLPELDSFAAVLPDAERALFLKLITKVTQQIMNDFTAYSGEFAEAFEAGAARMTMSYSEADTDAATGGGKYHSAYIKP